MQKRKKLNKKKKENEGEGGQDPASETPQMKQDDNFYDLDDDFIDDGDVEIHNEDDVADLLLEASSSAPMPSEYLLNYKKKV